VQIAEAIGIASSTLNEYLRDPEVEKYRAMLLAVPDSDTEDNDLIGGSTRLVPEFKEVTFHTN